MFIFMVFILLFFFWPTLFWILMLIDCMNRNFNNPTDKIAWILVLILLNFIGATLYYFLVKNKN